MFQGYWNKPEVTEKEFTKDGWFKTGREKIFDKNYSFIIRYLCKF